MWRRSTIYRLYIHAYTQHNEPASERTNKQTNFEYRAFAFYAQIHREQQSTHSSSSCRPFDVSHSMWISLSYCWCSYCCRCCCFSITLFAVAGRYFVWFLMCNWRRRRRRPKWMGNARKANKNEAGKTIKPLAHTLLLLATSIRSISSAAVAFAVCIFQWDSFATITTHLFDRATIHVDWYTSVVP